MKKGLNPLYPRSDGEGLMGAFQYAVLIDDDKMTYGSKKVPRKIGEVKMPAPSINSISPTWKEYNANSNQIMAHYHATMKELRKMKRTKQISRWQFHQAHRALAADTNTMLRHNYSEYMCGTLQTTRESARWAVQPQTEKVEEPKKNINLDKLEF